MLGGMARELDSELLGRLQRQYGEMSDGELLRLAARPDELTDMALEVLRGEMQRRHLQTEQLVCRDGDVLSAARTGACAGEGAGQGYGPAHYLP
jgi:hypothetical protein